MSIPAAEYYEDRAVVHTAQGDIYTGIPSVYCSYTVAEDASGARKRGGVAAAYAPVVMQESPVVVCSYTCGFTAQPPGTHGYSHPFRLVAPVHSLRWFREAGVTPNELRKVRDQGGLHGLLWLPQTERLALDGSASIDEWTGHAAAAIYRSFLVTQAALDGAERIHRLSEPAQRALISRLIQVVSPNSFDPDDPGLRPPDMTDGWESPPPR